MRNILICGAHGFMGSHLVNVLKREACVYALDCQIPCGAAEEESLRWVQHDVALPLVDLDLPTPFDAIVHLAQSPWYRHFPEKATDLFRTNVLGTFHVLEYARLTGARVLVFASSGSVCAPSREPLREDAPVTPLSFYATTKHMGEQMLVSYRTFFPGVIIRFFTVYGPGQKNGLIPQLVERIRTGLPVEIEGRPGFILSPLHVQDAVRVLCAAIKLRRSELIHAGGDEAVSITDLARLVAQALGRSAELQYKAGDVAGGYVADNRRMKDVLGIGPSVCLADGIASLIAGR